MITPAHWRGRELHDGGYVSVGWLLTGEAREYNAKRGTVGRLKPNAPLR